MAVIITAILKAKPGKEPLLREELKKVLPASREEEGCVKYTLHESLDDKGTFMFYEIWKDETALQHHMEAPHYKEYRKNVADLLETREVYRLEEVVE
ncbi:putative quinol monooxygenase [Heyndrickxia acidicola]|uniref:Quinol monooxygenase n=1 Tax=Heyndrickxia acidicola TaxID=209389 RepID=A0ABU6MNA8_9BACI|nr:putative quinol monooxygenase [Heyndrickxia acidicola]MED1205799.1 putative quinol monooxygenase [Heyndrickxia acidicola]